MSDHDPNHPFADSCADTIHDDIVQASTGGPDFTVKTWPDSGSAGMSEPRPTMDELWDSFLDAAQYDKKNETKLRERRRAIEEQAATEARRELLAKVEAEQPCTCNPAYGRILGADGAHALECVGRTSLRNGIRRLLEEPDHAD